MTKHTYRCDRCDTNDAATRFNDDFPVCLVCDEDCTRVFWCRTCGENVSAEGSEDCLECCVDYIVSNPSELDGFHKTLRLAMVPVLAKRLKPFMRLRQAA